MAATTQNTNNTTIKSILLVEKLTGSNFRNRYRNMIIVLMYEKKMKFMEQLIRPAPDPETANPVTIDKYYKTVNFEQEVACLMYSKEDQNSCYVRYTRGLDPKGKRKPRGEKGEDKGNNKLAYAPKPEIPPPPKRYNPAKDSVCHHYKECLRRSKKLKHGAFGLYMSNGMRSAIEAIRSFDLIIPIDNIYPNVSSTFNVSNKRVKYSLDSYYLWHYRIGHMNKKRMDKLQRDGILQPTHDESLDKCKSCISGKMAHKPFSHKVERAKDLLALIHTDVYGLFRTVSRERASYFITFTDDFSHYGYVYLMKHKHEGYALKSIARIINMVPTKKVERTHYEVWHGKAPKSWNKRFDVEIKKIGFTQNPNGPCVYLKASGSSVAFLILYVDDILLMRNKVTMLQEVKSWLSKCYYMKDLGEVAYILGIKIIHDRYKRLIALIRRAYLEKILKKFRIKNSKKGYTPMMENLDYRKSQGDKTPSKQNPGEIHWTAVKTILKYLRNTKYMVLVYGEKPEAELKVSCFADASFQTDKDDTNLKRDICSYVMVEPKFVDGLGDVVPSNERPMVMLCDNEPTIAIAGDPDIQCADSDTRPPMLDRTDFTSWQQHIRLYCQGKENGVNILKSIDEGPFQMGTVREPLVEGTKGAPHLGPERRRVYSDLSPEEKDRYNDDIKETNILLQGLPNDIYTLINHYTDAKDIWDNVKMLLEGLELTKEDWESQLYDDFEHFR
nr:retrotransposon protein, putative, Ty1-copia subclass [Tanacetum cinerariifolium]